MASAAADAPIPAMTVRRFDVVFMTSVLANDLALEFACRHQLLKPFQNKMVSRKNEIHPSKNGRANGPSGTPARKSGVRRSDRQLVKRMRSSRSALTQQTVSIPTGPVPNERRRRRPPHGRRTGTT